MVELSKILLYDAVIKHLRAKRCRTYLVPKLHVSFTSVPSHIPRVHSLLSKYAKNQTLTISLIYASTHRCSSTTSTGTIPETYLSGDIPFSPKHVVWARNPSIILGPCVSGPCSPFSIPRDQSSVSIEDPSCPEPSNEVSQPNATESRNEKIWKDAP